MSKPDSSERPVWNKDESIFSFVARVGKESPPTVAWYEDKAKLLAAVVARATTDEAFKKSVLEAAVAVAGSDKALRTILRSGLRQQSQAANLTRGRARKPEAICTLLSVEYEILTTDGFSGDAAREKQHSIHCDLAPERIQKLVTRGKKIRKECGSI